MARSLTCSTPARKRARPVRRRRLASLAVLLVAIASHAPAQVIDLSWQFPDGDIYAGQTFPLTLEVTATVEGDGGFVQLFPQPLGLPLQVEAFAAITGLVLAPGFDQGDSSLVLDGEIVRTQAQPGGPGVTRHRITRLAQARREGPVALPEVAATYATCSGFRQDLVRGSVPVDRMERVARGASRTIEILPLPEADQPVDFEGAVGPFTITCSVAPNSAQVGDTLRLTVDVLGGPLPEDQGLPRLELVEGLRQVGTRRETAVGALGTRITFDLTATSTAPMWTPTPTLVVFDPTATPPAYDRLSGAALPIAIRARQGVASEPAAGPAGDGEEPARKPRLVWTPAVAAFIVLFAAISTLRRRRGHGGGHP